MALRHQDQNSRGELISPVYRKCPNVLTRSCTILHVKCSDCVCLAPLTLLVLVPAEAEHEVQVHEFLCCCRISSPGAVVQISKEVRLFAKVMDLAVVAAYGGSGVKEQINGLKRGAHVVACTPGRMIDILVTSNGSITNLRRVTMLVIDEADRMFDMGFEPQISRLLGQIRPARQTVLFSATFPRQVEILARAILTDPVEIQVRFSDRLTRRHNVRGWVFLTCCS